MATAYFSTRNISKQLETETSTVVTTAVSMVDNGVNPDEIKVNDSKTEFPKTEVKPTDSRVESKVDEKKDDIKLTDKLADELKEKPSDKSENGDKKTSGDSEAKDEPNNKSEQDNSKDKVTPTDSKSDSKKPVVEKPSEKPN